MHYLRKSKPSGGTPPPTLRPSTQVIQKLTSDRDSTALVATSSAIALSITSAFGDACDVPDDGAGDKGKDAGWRTAYATARMAVDVAKESSDMFLPLKAVVGAVSALMKHCDVSMPYV